MKTRQDPRHRQRVKVMESLFTKSFGDSREAGARTRSIIKHLDHVDNLISQAAPERPIEKIAKVDLAILRLAVYELVIDKSQPPKVIIDEAVELAKEYGGEGSAPFINGALGMIYSTMAEKKPHHEPKKTS